MCWNNIWFTSAATVTLWSGRVKHTILLVCVIVGFKPFVLPIRVSLSVNL